MKIQQQEDFLLSHAGGGYLSSFQLFQQKRWSGGLFNCISTVTCKGLVCVEVLTCFYDRFFVEVGQFNRLKVPPHCPPTLGQHFFLHLLTPSRFGALNREGESSGSRSVYQKLFPHGPHTPKNKFFEIKISRPTPLDSLSVLL